MRNINFSFFYKIHEKKYCRQSIFQPQKSKVSSLVLTFFYISYAFSNLNCIFAS